MNCFRITIFDIRATARYWRLENGISCELLSNYYLWHTSNSRKYWPPNCEDVVNCFRITIFDIRATATPLFVRTSSALWIAFELLSLTYEQQPIVKIEDGQISCELLSNYYLWHTSNSTWRTAWRGSTLWIAFELLSLTYEQQLNVFCHNLINCCELLSNYYLWHTSNSKIEFVSQFILVVNCFRITIFDIRATAKRNGPRWMKPLWIAFELLSLTYEQQRAVCASIKASCCELLSNYYLWHTSNSKSAFRII